MIKKQTKTVEVPAIPAATAEVAEYVCETCGKTFDDERAAKIHYGNQHCGLDYDVRLCRYKHYLAGHPAAWLRTEWDLECALDSLKSGGFCDYFAAKTKRAWQGPGWYAFTSDNAPCGRGCCSNEVGGALFIDDVEDILLKELKAKIDDIRELRAKKKTTA